MPRLSVIVPVKNGELTIARALDSTLRALPADSEIVVFNDGSTDATLSLVQSYDSRVVRVITAPQSVGVATALNLLLEHTDSEFVARMDADDITLRGRFHYQRRAISPAAEVNFTTVLNWRPDARRIGLAAPLAISARALPFHLLLTNPVSHPTMFARRDALTRVGGYRPVPAEDYDLWLRLAAAGVGIRRLPRPTLLYRVHPGQVTASLAWRHASWTDPDVASAFADLSQSVLGRSFRRLTTLGFSPDITPADFERSLADFARAFRASTMRLPRSEQLIVNRKLGQRIETVRAMRANVG
ncbi:glycosyltransferase family 2 protein [Leifsonia sp. YAF41]|uniref:glycosyltransferase family 2 protein n=1 Tax=Leifsonia sp. YAF41 TaxID=3233086 RepID=UPI003F9A8700